MIKKIFFIVLAISLLFLAVAETSQKYILLEVYYNDGNFTILNKSLEQGSYPTLSHKAENRYNLNLVSENKNVLYSISFDPALLFSDAGNETLEGGLVILNETIFFIAVPDSREAEKIEILEDNKKIFEEEVYDVGASSCKVE